MTEQQTISSEGKSNKKPRSLVLAGVLATGLLGTALLPYSPMAIAQTNVVTPYANAPFSFADLAEKVRPAVVSIQVKNGAKKTRRGQNFEFKGPDLPDGHPLKEFFKQFGNEGPRGQHPQRPRQSQGSGFIISSDGYVVTNHHVIHGGSKISVIMDNGDKHDAEIIGSDERTDLALLKIKTKKKLHFVKFADKKARVGDWVLAVGNPFGLGGTVTVGIVSAHKRNIGSGPYDFLQIDAAVNRGNSGGPAFGLDGTVIGVNTAIFSPSGGNVGIAFAVPSVLAKRVIDQLKSNGKVARGWLGVTIQSVDDDIAASLGLDEPKGAMVTSLSKNSPASKSDMEVGDLIIAVDGSVIDDSRDLARKIAGYAPSSKVSVTVLRDDKEQDITIKLGTFPNSKQLASLQKSDKKPASEEMEDLGLSLAPASEFTSGSIEEGVVIVEVSPDSDAAEKGLKAGDIILEVAGDIVSDPADVAKSIRKAKDKGRRSVHMLVRSGDRQRFIALPLKKV
jgi:serine protease Do